MNITELQILFQQKIQDTNESFDVDQRPDSYTIEGYLNKAMDRYLETKYLRLPTFQHRLAAIDANMDELHTLITADGSLSSVKNTTEYNWSTRGHRYRVPSDVLIPISITCDVTRTEIYPQTSQRLFTDWVSRRQAEKLISTTSNKVMYVKPISVWEDPYYIMIIGDAYTTAITGLYLTYLRKPYKLDFNYAELTGVGTGNLDITAITNGTYFLTKSNMTYVDSLGTPTTYKAGDKVLKVTGYNTVTYVDELLIVGYPWGSTDTPDLPSYLHEPILDTAVSMFLDEAKLKLITKNN